MKIEFIGTGSIGAVQLSASTLIDDRLLIDMGNGIIKKLKQTDHKLEDIENCFITHLHGDHFADIPFLMLDRFFHKIQNPIHIYGPEGIEEKVKQLFDILFPGDYQRVYKVANIKFIEIEPKRQIEIEKKTVVNIFEVEHGDCNPAYGFIIEKDNQKLGFSGDSTYCEAISKIVERSNLSILDMSAIVTNKNHMGLEDIIKIATTYPNKKIATTHMQKNAREKAKEKRIRNLIIPDDGDIVNL